ncbi:ATP-binding protein [Soehngenia longivitae]|uniref:endopeptidase La n=1 Tax=Soehngenia longivitae TaxID=2562294 RepID=A0A4Z0D9E8_9FIRM|nr:ATP-binding protein [Soehngenia longivitae]TFZ41483.1 ATP-binding protein [Soehngenia longivitae]
MNKQYRLYPEDLKSNCSLDKFDFETTKDLEPLRGIIGQERGTKALQFGLMMNKKGYNIYVSGMSGTGRSSFAYSIAEEFCKKRPVPKDWVYVYNFSNNDSPQALSFEAGKGKEFKKDLEGAINDLRKEIPEKFQGIEYETRMNDIFKVINQKKSDIVKKLNEKSTQYGFVYTPSETGLVSIPVKNGKPISEEEYANLSLEEREKLIASYEELRSATVEEFDALRILDEELEKSLIQLDKTLASEVVTFQINKLKNKYDGSEKTLNFFERLEEDIMENINRFKKKITPMNYGFPFYENMEESFFTRYKVNLFVDNSNLEHAPIINETNPVYINLMGNVEYKSLMGVLTTDFTQIKPGSLHQANGGYIIFQMKEILNNPISWEMLKRALKTEEINIENYNRLLGLAITDSLKPEPIPLDVKVIIIGDNYTYDLLYTYDDDFRKLFKVMADFDVEMNKNSQNLANMGYFIANQCKTNGLKHLDKKAVERIIEYSSRIAEHKDKLSTNFNQIIEILYEADFWANEDKALLINEDHVLRAIDEKISRVNKYEEKINEMFKEGTLILDIDGERVGEINGLAVIGTGEYSFGKPNKITATVYSGRDGILNIERETKQSGPIHTKGVLTLNGYIGERYAKDKPLGVTIGLGFEQSYSYIEGDSASCAELYAILSALSGYPIKQSIAITGSMNQKGRVQPIGGVNEKIEGFFRLCKEIGFTGEQGVIIPKSNVKNLILKDEVVEKVREGKFNIYAIEDVKDGVEIMFGKTMEELDKAIFENLKKINEDKDKLDKEKSGD